jgi:hypothetical protein
MPLLKPLSRERERGWGEGKLLAGKAKAKAKSQEPRAKAALIRPFGAPSPVHGRRDGTRRHTVRRGRGIGIGIGIGIDS